MPSSLWWRTKFQELYSALEMKPQLSVICYMIVKFKVDILPLVAAVLQAVQYLCYDEVVIYITAS